MVERRNRRYHDRIAGRYERIYDGAYWRFYREISWRHLKAFLPARRPAVAADLGCGPGWFGLRLLKAGFDTVFVDPSGAMLERARRKVEEAGFAAKSRFIQGELEDLAGIAAGELAFATAQGDPLSFCRDPRRAVAELGRVLGPGAAAVLSVDSRPAGVASLRRRGAAAEMLALLADGRTRWLAKRPGEAFSMHMFDPGELRALFARAGFEVLSLIGKTCLAGPNEESWLEDPALRRRLLAAEERVHAKPWYLGLAGHLQIAVRRPQT